MQVSLSCDFTVPYSQSPLALSSMAQSPLLRCEVCKKSFKSMETLSAHLDSVKHKKRESEVHKVSPAKKSPSKSSSLSSSEHQASLLQGSRAAQAFFDVATQYAQIGDASATVRCLQKCLLLLPKISPDAKTSVSRVMIEVRCRTLLARIAWNSGEGTAEIDLACRLFHVQNASPLQLVKEGSVFAFAEMDEACEKWRKGLRHAELEAHFAPLAREFGSRMCAQTPQMSAAVLLYCGRQFDFAAVVFEGLKLFGHAGECLFRQNEIGPCVQLCILHSNLKLLRKCAQASAHPVLLQLSDAFCKWDLVALDTLACAPKLLASERDLIKLAILVLSKCT